MIQVAQSLGLRTRRKPPGFWDNEDSLDEEISLFVADFWTEHCDGATSDTYFYNQVSAPCFHRPASLFEYSASVQLTVIAHPRLSEI